MFNIIFIVASCFALAFGAPPTPPLNGVPEAAIQKCIPLLPNVPADVVKSIASNPYYTTEDAEAKCSFRCIGIETAVIDSEGRLLKEVFSADRLPKFLDGDKVKQHFDGCTQKVTANPCDNAYQQWNCIVTKAKKDKPQ